MDKLKYIIIVLVIAVLAYFLLKRPSAEEQSAAAAAKAAAEEAAADAAIKQAKAKAENAIQDTIANTELTAEEKQEQIALQQQVKKQAEQEEIKRAYDKALAAYNNLSVDEKWSKQNTEFQKNINNYASSVYTNMKGTQKHNYNFWKTNIEPLLSSEAKFFWFVHRYPNYDNTTLYARMKKQNWGYTTRKKAGGDKEMKELATKIMNKANTITQDVLLKKAGDVIPGYTGEIPEVYQA